MSGTNILTATVLLGGSLFMLGQSLVWANLASVQRYDAAVESRQRGLVSRLASEARDRGEPQDEACFRDTAADGDAQPPR
jgi:hypothetical protein